jgi:hypothetical protein
LRQESSKLEFVLKTSYSRDVMLGGAAFALTIAGSAACLGMACFETVQRSTGRSIIEREWSPTAPKCNLQHAGNVLGTGLILYCEPSATGQSEAPTWLYSMSVVYTITDSAGPLTPKLRSLADADDEAFRLTGLDRQRFQEQMADMIAEQRKQKTAP